MEGETPGAARREEGALPDAEDAQERVERVTVVRHVARRVVADDEPVDVGEEVLLAGGWAGRGGLFGLCQTATRMSREGETDFVGAGHEHVEHLRPRARPARERVRV